MARRGYCEACGREVWQGRDGGCQFGHPASQFSGVREVDPKTVNQGVSGPTPAARPATPPARPATPPARPAPVSPMPAAVAPRPAPVAPPPYAPPVPVAPAPYGSPVSVAATGPQAYAAAPAVGFAAAVAPAQVAPTVAAPSAEGWGNSPDDLTGAAVSGFDYMSLSNEVSIGNTDCLVRRVIARVFDNVLLGVVEILLLVPFLLTIVASAQQGPMTSRPSSPAWFTPVSLLLYTAYFVVLPHFWKGRTVGKAMCGIAVTDMQDHAPEMWQLGVRELTMILPDGLLNGIVGLVVAAKSSNNQRFGDQWAGTVVVRTR